MPECLPCCASHQIPQMCGVCLSVPLFGDNNKLTGTSDNGDVNGYIHKVVSGLIVVPAGDLTERMA